MPVIDLDKERDFLDFGKGFYTTTSKKQAILWAESATNRKKNGTPTVSKYRLEGVEDLSVKVFESANIEWLGFVVKCRTTRGVCHNYDIVKGPVADDDARFFLDGYQEGIYGFDISGKMLFIELMGSIKLKEQIYFSSEKAIKALTFLGSVG
ncbi:DUF3990 domain-containing protein [Paenibacillus sp. 19GGS1-52]|nr:DUF3990 domain-containing protein [Paenibacillus sp. 19GGS1-52]